MYDSLRTPPPPLSNNLSEYCNIKIALFFFGKIYDDWHQLHPEGTQIPSLATFKDILSISD